MTRLRRKLDAVLKVQVVLEAIRGKRTITEIASEYGVHPNQITAWKRYFLIWSSKNGHPVKLLLPI